MTGKKEIDLDLIADGVAITEKLECVEGTARFVANIHTSTFCMEITFVT